MSAFAEAQRRLVIWESEGTLKACHRRQTSRCSGFQFLAPRGRSRCSWPCPGATPPAGAGPGRVKTWNPEKLNTCRAPRPRRFSGFQISRFPLPRWCAVATCCPGRWTGLLERQAASSPRLPLPHSGRQRRDRPRRLRSGTLIHPHCTVAGIRRRPVQTSGATSARGADRQAASGVPNLNTSLVCGSKRSEALT